MRSVLIEEAGTCRHPRHRLLPALLAALLLLFLAAPVASPLFISGAQAQDTETVRVLSVEHSIDFGHSIDVRLEAEVSGPVTEVRAVYTPLGPGNVSSYAYPQFTQQGELVQADLRIDTGGRAYYPPGTEFEVFFELTSAGGSVNATEPSRILYLDPGRDWQSLSRSDIPLDIHYYGFPEETAEAIANRMASSWSGIAAAVGADSDGRYRAVIYPDIADFTPDAPPISEAASDGLFFAGFAMHEYRLFVLGVPSAESAVHELTHLLVDSTVTSPLSHGVPSWLHEGLAQFFEAGSSEPYSEQLRDAARSGDLLTLHNRNRVPARADELGLFYTQVGSFVGGLIEHQGAERMAETLRLINEGETAADAVETAYGRALWELENDWRVSLGAEPLPAPAGQDGGTATASAATPGPVDSPQTQATSTAEGIGIGVDETPEDSDGGFNWIGPVVGAAAAAVVFVVWSVVVNRRRFGRRRR